MTPKFEITVTAEPENVFSVRGHFDGDDADTKAMVDDIIDRARSGDTWAWCCVKVTVSCGDLEEHEYLGCCSYQSEEDFRTDSGYFDDMVKECKSRLIAGARAVLDAHEREEAVKRGEAFETLMQTGAKHSQDVAELIRTTADRRVCGHCGGSRSWKGDTAREFTCDDCGRF